jgi:hypothetical protein
VKERITWKKDRLWGAADYLNGDFCDCLRTRVQKTPQINKGNERHSGGLGSEPERRKVGNISPGIELISFEYTSLVSYTCFETESACRGRRTYCA